MDSEKRSPRLELLGGFRLSDALGKDIRVSSRKSRALLAIIALSPGLAAMRARVRGLLWGDRGERQASDSLRQTLVALKRDLKALEISPLALEGDVVKLDSRCLEIDVVEFRRAEQSGDAAKAAALYRGNLLEGCDFGDDGFEEWVRAERAALMARAILVLEKHVAELAGEAKAEAAKRLVSLDPLREASHRWLMKSYAEEGEIALARKQFDTCRALLERELGAAPSKVTTDLLATIFKEATLPKSPSPPQMEPVVQPTLAVLPFANMSGESSQQYFSDGITQDIITELSRFHELQIHASPAAHSFSSHLHSVRTGRELGVKYLVEGGVRKINGRIRINIQLIEIESGRHLWAERFDRDEEQIFAVQDQLVRTIVGTIVGRVKAAGVEQVRRKPPASLAAYECVLRAEAYPIGVPEAEAEARRLYEKAIELDPGYARAYMLLAAYLTLEWYRDMSGSEVLLDRALELAQIAVSLDENDERCQAMLGRAHMLRRSFELAEHYHLKALELNPNSPLLMAGLGILYGFLGEPERAVEYFKEMKRLDPLSEPSWYWRNRGIVHFIARQYDQAIMAFKRTPITPDWVHAFLAASYAYLNATDDARRHAAEVLRLTPDFSLNRFCTKDPFKRSEDRQHLADGLRAAGLPE